MMNYIEESFPLPTKNELNALERKSKFQEIILLLQVHILNIGKEKYMFLNLAI